MTFEEQIMNGRPGEKEIRERFRKEVAPILASKAFVETRTPWVGNDCIVPCNQREKAEFTGRIIDGCAEFSWD